MKQRIKNIFKNTLANLYYSTRRYKREHKGKLIILTYHRVLSRKELKKEYVQPGMFVEKGVFEKQIQFLKTVYHIISFQEYLERCKYYDWDPNQQYCIITFDDGWRDNYDYAFPILKRYAIPATIFLATSFIGTFKWFWPERIARIFSESDSYSLDEIVTILWKILGEMRQIKVQTPSLSGISADNLHLSIDSFITSLKRNPPDLINKFIYQAEKELKIKQTSCRMLMNWNEVEEMAVENISFGSHGCNHKILTLIPEEEMHYEIKESKNALLNHKTNYVPVFCYPNGNFSPSIADYVSISGYKAATSTIFGVNTLQTANSCSLKRIGVHNDISKNLPLFSLRLSNFLERS